MNAAKERLPELVELELDSANRHHTPFHSLHEAYAVIREEIEESMDELTRVRMSGKELWRAVKDDDSRGAEEHIREIELYAVNLAAEAIQVAAMAQKALQLTAFLHRHD